MEDSDPVSQEKVVIDDTAKLRMLGYDPMLGRTFGFWSSAGLNFCHMSFIFDFVMYATMYGYPAPLMFVSGR